MIRRIQNWHNYLIVLLLFTITINTSVSYVLIAAVFLLWLLDGGYRQKLDVILHDKLALSFLAIFMIYLLGMLWTQDMQDGWKILSKQKMYLFAPLVISFFDRRFARYAIYAFLAAIFISEIYSIYLYAVSGVQMTGSLPSPFMHHMHYSLILAFTFGYLVSEIDFHEIKSRKTIFYLLFAILTLVVLFINKGRIGQVALLPVLFVLAIWKFRLSLVKSIVAVVTGAAILFFAAYHLSDQFKTRVDYAGYEFEKVVGTGKRDSIVCRFEMWGYATALGKENPLIGIGTGDGVCEMERLLGKDGFQDLYQSCGLGLKYMFNPHNNFLFYFMLFGTAGVLLLAGVLLIQFMIAYRVGSPGMMILLVVTVMGMLTASPVSVHVKYIFFYTLMLTMLYLDAKAKQDAQSAELNGNLLHPLFVLQIALMFLVVVA